MLCFIFISSFGSIFDGRISRNKYWTLFQHCPIKGIIILIIQCSEENSEMILIVNYMLIILLVNMFLFIYYSGTRAHVILVNYTIASHNTTSVWSRSHIWIPHRNTIFYKLEYYPHSITVQIISKLDRRTTSYLKYSHIVL